MTSTLLIGNRRYSSWSLRGWLLFHAFGAPVEVRLARMFGPEFAEALSAHPPARSVPTAVIDGDVVWDSLAIAETLAERLPDAGHWPSDPTARAWARSLAAEMHAGFQALRSAMPMNMDRRAPGAGRKPGVDADVARLESLWGVTRARFAEDGGPYLFGARYTVADAFFAPVASRLETYAVDLGAEAGAYAEALRAHPSYRMWAEEAAQEPWFEARYDVD